MVNRRAALNQLRKLLRQLFAALTRGCIDDSGARRLGEKRQQRLQLVVIRAGGFNFKMQIRAGEPGYEHARLTQLKLPGDVGPDKRRSGRSQSNGLRVAEALAKA